MFLMGVDKDRLEVTAKTTVIPLRPEMALNCQINATFTFNLGLIEQYSRVIRVIVGSILVNLREEQTPAVVAKYLPQPKHGKVLAGLCQEVNQELQSCIFRRSLTKPKEEMPDHLCDLFYRSFQCLDELQAKELKELLGKNTDIFPE